MGEHSGLKTQLEKALRENAKLKAERLLSLMEELGIDPLSIPGQLLIHEYRPESRNGYALRPIQLWLAVELGTVID